MCSTTMRPLLPAITMAKADLAGPTPALPPAHTPPPPTPAPAARGPCRLAAVVTAWARQRIRLQTTPTQHGAGGQRFRTPLSRLHRQPSSRALGRAVQLKLMPQRPLAPACSQHSPLHPSRWTSPQALRRCCESMHCTTGGCSKQGPLTLLLPVQPVCPPLRTSRPPPRTRPSLLEQLFQQLR